MAFPYSIPVLDSFTRADGAIGSNWTTWSAMNGDLLISANTARGVAGGANYSGDYWNPNTFGPDSGCYVTAATANGSAPMYMFLRLTASTTFYYLQIVGSTWTIVKRITGSDTTLGTRTQAVSNGDAIGMSAIGTAIAVYYKPSGGSWSQLGADFTDSGISGAGNCGFGTNSNDWQYTDFGAGTIAGTSPPVADFTGTPTSGSAPLSVAFTDTSTGGAGTSWHWEKNNGSGWVDFASTPTAQNPTESFS